MATTATSRTGSDAASVPFSYAQAAKGLSAAPGSSTNASKTSSGDVTPAKDSQTVTTSAAAVMSWAEDAEANDPRSEKLSGARESRIQAPKTAGASRELTASILSSPEMGASTASTVTKDDDVSSVPNTSSDSTWENKSQASTSVDKSTEPSEKSSQKAKAKKGEQPSAKPLQEAPVPMVNIWQQRAESRQKPGKSNAANAQPNGVSAGIPSSVKQSKDTAENGESRGKIVAADGKLRSSEEDKAQLGRQDSRNETDVDKVKKSAKGRQQEKDTRPISTVFSLPPDRDQESWPTMETAIDEDRKKAQEKTEKSDKDRKETSSSKAGGKGKWVNVPIVPTVVFNTPLPSSGARRGGRNAARGGTQSGGRAGGFSANGPEKETSAPVTMSNGDQSRRGRPDASARESSPKGKRTVSAGSLAAKDKPAQLNGEKLPKTAQVDADAQLRGTSVLAESQNNAAGAGQHNTFPRQYPSSRPNKGRRADWPSQDRRKDGDSVSPMKENGVNIDHRTSSSTQTDAPEDVDRRSSNYADGQPPHQSKRGNNDRFGSFSSRERRGGGARGGRGGSYSNGHQFANGHTSVKPSSTYPGPMSPTTFNPEQTPYFPPPNRFRNGPRSQSVTTENVYRMPGQYGGPQQQIPPINTYTNGNVYDYSMMQPMSAVPYGQFGMDHFALFSMVTTQLEYYFSLENLCKDMFLRKHMDSKGFVYLNVIADFNRIKHLTTDLELIKLVCYQSRTIEFRVGHDGKDRLRAREGWQQWVLPIAERDSSAQNEGPEELYNPPIPHPNGFDPNGNPRYPDMSATSPTAPVTFGSEGPYPAVNGFHPGASQHGPVLPNEGQTNGVIAEGVNGNAIPNGHPIDNSTKAVSGEPDSFSDAQVESLTVIVRKQDHSQMPVLPPSTTRTFSNRPYSRNEVSDKSEERVDCHCADLPGRVESQVQYQPQRTTSPFASTSSITPFRLYWVKDNAAPVDNVPLDCFHESYHVLRSKALQQRQQSFSGSCSYDMSVLYQFWSHFLVRNFNTRMYDEFHLFALEDARDHLSEVGLSILIKFYGESLLSCQNVIRDRVAHDFVDLIRSENEHRRPAFQQLRLVLHNDNMNAQNRIRINDFLDDQLKASLE
ncbi:hypothetical protein N0V90_006754 [Kalmusia sp. IMI 367209]|nr:hypothetical protein N0V90_006754 [Kalmusia sp. IMI 367209]